MDLSEVIWIRLLREYVQYEKEGLWGTVRVEEEPVKEAFTHSTNIY